MALDWKKLALLQYALNPSGDPAALGLDADGDLKVVDDQAQALLQRVIDAVGEDSGSTINSLLTVLSTVDFATSANQDTANAVLDRIIEAVGEASGASILDVLISINADQLPDNHNVTVSNQIDQPLTAAERAAQDPATATNQSAQITEAQTSNTKLGAEGADPPDIIGSGVIGYLRGVLEELADKSGIFGVDRAIDGALIAHSRISRISLYSHRPLAENRITTAGTTGSGSVTQDADKAEFALSVNAAVAGLAQIESLAINRYHTNREWYFTLPVRFTPGVTGVVQRVGGFDDSNGFYLAEDAGVIKFVTRKTPPSTGITAESEVLLTNANGDFLDGASGLFKRGSALEAYNEENKSIWRIRAVLHGSSVNHFDIQDPNGRWIRVHTNRFPNLQQGASILDWDLPFRAEVESAGTGTGTITMGLGSVDGGWVGNPASLEPSETDSREHYEINLIGETTQGLKASIPAGTEFVVKTMNCSGENGSTTSAMSVRFRDGDATGTLIFPFRINESVGGLGGINETANHHATWPEGKVISEGVFMEVVTGTPIIDLSLVGYLRAPEA